VGSGAGTATGGARKAVGRCDQRPGCSDGKPGGKEEHAVDVTVDIC